MCDFKLMFITSQGLLFSVYKDTDCKLTELFIDHRYEEWMTETASNSAAHPEQIYIFYAKNNFV